MGICCDLICPLLPDQWDVQATIKRLVASLQKKRGYVVWFGANRLQSLIDIADPSSPVRCCTTDLESMKGSVVDA